MKQVDVLKTQIELEKRRAVVQTQQTYDWLVNLVLVIVSLVVIVMLARKLFASSPSRPAYTSAPQNR
jgi:putative copper export protein